MDLTPDFGGILKYANQGELIDFIEKFEKDPTIRSAFIYHHNAVELLQNVRACFTNILAAGGLVWNSDRTRFLSMRRLGYFDLPKGKVEKDELFEEAAVREVKEECQISNLEIERPLVTTFHTYRIHEKRILKETRWYEMNHPGNDEPAPQKEENIESVFWMDPRKISLITDQTYPSILEVLNAAMRQP